MMLSKKQQKKYTTLFCFFFSQVFKLTLSFQALNVYYILKNLY